MHDRTNLNCPEMSTEIQMNVYEINLKLRSREVALIKTKTVDNFDELIEFHGGIENFKSGYI
jgi:hypothetical protein